MSSTNQVDIIAVCELVDHIFAESERYASIVLAPLLDIFVGVRPKQIAQETSVRHISRSHNVFDSVDLVEFGGQTAMHTQNLIVDERSDR